jgi:hypothetical protein
MFDDAAKPPPPPDPGRALTKVLDAQRKKAEQAAAKQAEAQRLAELARRAVEDHGRHALATPFGQSVAAAPRGLTSADEAPAAPAASSQRPAAPRGFFSDDAAVD